MAQYEVDTRQSDDGAVSERVVAAVADARDVDPLDLTPIYNVINPEALDRLYDHGRSDGRNGPGRVVFTMAGCEVVVHSDGAVDVTAPDERSPASSAAANADEQDETDTSFE